MRCTEMETIGIKMNKGRGMKFGVAPQIMCIQTLNVRTQKQHIVYWKACV